MVVWIIVCTVNSVVSLFIYFYMCFVCVVWISLLVQVFAWCFRLLLFCVCSCDVC